MKEIIIAFCTPDLNRPAARRAIEALKSTDLRRAELMILDNAYDPRFHHPSVMDEILNVAGSRPVIFMDDDAIVRERTWIERLWRASEEAGAAVVGCTHTSVAGERNHTGILVYYDGSTELTRGVPPGSGTFAYAPAVSSAVMLVHNDRGLRFDRRYDKYHHDTDIGLAAWAAGHRVACALDLEIVHAQADYAARVSDVRELLARDLLRFQDKWRDFIAGALYARAELAFLANAARQPNWDRVYNHASALERHDPAGAARAFRQLLADCPNDWHRAGAYYHLYLLERDAGHLEACLRENPGHQKAARLLQELEAASA